MRTRLLLRHLDGRERGDGRADGLLVARVDADASGDIGLAGGDGARGIALRRQDVQMGEHEDAPVDVHPPSVDGLGDPEVKLVEAILEPADAPFAHKIPLRPRHVQRQGVREQERGR